MRKNLRGKRYWGGNTNEKFHSQTLLFQQL
jgi:hypothetical protein